MKALPPLVVPALSTSDLRRPRPQAASRSGPPPPAAGRQKRTAQRWWCSLALGLLLWSSLPAQAERLNWKPADFRPLTSLPWAEENAPLETVLQALFHEPNPALRYPLLAEYLRLVPVADLGRAFDRCLALEGTQTPDELVGFILPIWAEREPAACWARTRELFHLVGITEGWLNYSSWAGRERITVQDRAALNASPFWLRGPGLATFPLGIERSTLAVPERVRIMKEFAETWLTAFGTWPQTQGLRSYGDPFESHAPLLDLFRRPAATLRDFDPSSVSYHKLQCEIARRRWLEAEPTAAPHLMQTILAARWPDSEGGWQLAPQRPSTELFMVWARVDLPGMIRWAETLSSATDFLAVEARAFLMSRVDAATRERWLREARSPVAGEDHTRSLLEGWAAWDPPSALAALVAMKDLEALQAVPEKAAYGPFGSHPVNASQYGLSIIKDFDVATLPAALRPEIVRDWGATILAQWGGIDLAEAARYGLDFLLRYHVVPRENLLQLFAGDDHFAGENELLDRTFCALRVWAVVRPDEMQAWIEKLPDAKLRQALTWLQENPWGGPDRQR